ncbi:MAG TPA: folate-binding protein YgfZ [Bauldia sp.]|nr:folate-binding protein YgfZ [Bauldia sp.]
MPTAYLPDRSVIAVSGEDATRFLQDLVTCEVAELPAGEARWGALLSPQGKILFDFLVSGGADGGYRLDVARSIAVDLVKRLGFYKLRAKVRIGEPVADGEQFAVIAQWGIAGESGDVRDGRHPGLGVRRYVRESEARALADTGRAAYDAHRVALGIPEGGADFAYGEAFPHDVDMDQLGGVDFRKGCYVGQEVVSRMEHRGTARRRIVLAEGSPLPAIGTEVVAGERPVGVFGSHAGDRGLALVRLDRARAAIDAGTPITAGGVRLSLAIPAWARFRWPAADEMQADHA